MIDQILDRWSDGSTAYQIGIELKPSYFKHSARYLNAGERQGDMFLSAPADIGEMA